MRHPLVLSINFIRSLRRRRLTTWPWIYQYTRTVINFIIFVNDMLNVINSILLIFADDTKLYRTIDSSKDHNILQHNIDQLCVWGDQSVMSFNLDKCNVMSFGKHVRYTTVQLHYEEGCYFSTNESV